MGDWTGTVPSFPVGNLRSADMTTLADIDTALVTAWTTWSPTLTNLTLGNATQTAKYRRVGKTVEIFWQFILGSTSAVGTQPQFTLPANASTGYATAGLIPLVGSMFDASAGPVAQTRPLYISASIVQVNYWSGALTQASVTATAPWTWAVSDTICVWGTYFTD